jgi:hypothetical protein
VWCRRAFVVPVYRNENSTPTCFVHAIFGSDCRIGLIVAVECPVSSGDVECRPSSYTLAITTASLERDQDDGFGERGR